jgi:hypothetical protein
MGTLLTNTMVAMPTDMRSKPVQRERQLDDTLSDVHTLLIPRITHGPFVRFLVSLTFMFLELS